MAAIDGKAAERDPFYWRHDFLEIGPGHKRLYVRWHDRENFRLTF